MKGPIARGTIRTTFVLGLRLAVQASTLLLVARLLGPHQFGAFAGVAALAVMLGTLSTFGTHLVLLSEVSKDAKGREQILNYTIPTTLLCGAVLLAGYLLICTLLLEETEISLVTLAAIGAAEIWCQALLGLSVIEHLALGRVARSQLLMILPLALRLLAIAVVTILGPSDALSISAYGYLAASALAASFAYTTLPARWPGPSAWRLANPGELRRALGYAAMNITRTGPAELDKTVAIKLLPLAASGLYAAGARVIGAATLPVVAMMLSALPRLFREGLDQPQRTRRLLRWVFVAALGYSFALAIALWFIAPFFDQLFGQKYRGIDVIIRWLTIAVPGMALRTVAGNVLMALGKPWMRVGFEAIGLIILVVAAATIVPRLGMIGMPLALACSEWMMAVIGVALIARVRVNPKYCAPIAS
jgi:O-antigen/teichoic acid export membrane protein